MQYWLWKSGQYLEQRPFKFRSNLLLYEIKLEIMIWFSSLVGDLPTSFLSYATEVFPCSPNWWWKFRQQQRWKKWQWELSKPGASIDTHKVAPGEGHLLDGTQSMIGNICEAWAWCKGRLEPYKVSNSDTWTAAWEDAPLPLQCSTPTLYCL